MEASSRPRSTRDRPAKPPLSEELILDSALRICRDEGLEAVTMRRLATELDTGAASLYVYIRGRDELRAAMLDRLAAGLQLEVPDPALWRDQVQRLLLTTLQGLEQHPGLATVAVGAPLTNENLMLYMENLLGLLKAGGASDRDAAWAGDILMLIVTSVAVENDVRRQRLEDKEQFVARINEFFETLPADRFPTINALAGDMTAGEGADRFIFAVDVFLDGLVGRSARTT